MSCALCKAETPNQFCDKCLEAVKLVFVPAQPQSRAYVHALEQAAKQREERIYWLVREAGFQCVVDGRDASTEDEAMKQAHSRTQAWYFDKYDDWSFHDNYTSTRKLSHNEYCNWLRGVQ